MDSAQLKLEKGQIKFYNKIALPCEYYLDIYGVFFNNVANLIIIYYGK